MENPATASWGLSISDADFAKLKRGFKAFDMDDKWVFRPTTDKELSDEKRTNGATTDEVPTVDEDLTIEELLMDDWPRDKAWTDEATLDLDQGGDISIIRCWSKREFYRLIVKPSEGGTSAKIEAITWEQNQGEHISEAQAKIDAVLLCRQQIECDIAAAPDYDPGLFSALLGMLP